MAAARPSSNYTFYRLAIHARSPVDRPKFTCPWGRYVSTRRVHSLEGRYVNVDHTTRDISAMEPEVLSDSAKENVGPKLFPPLDTFARRHIGSNQNSTVLMLKSLDPPVETVDELIKQIIPPDILSPQLPRLRDFGGRDVSDFGWRKVTSNNLQLSTSTGLPESTFMALAEAVAAENKIYHNYIGCGYYGTLVPAVIKRNVLENPAWYTSYTPYQPEISQGRLASLLNFQTMVCDLTALPISNASLLDEATAAAEAMTMSINSLPAERLKSTNKTFLISHLVHPQTQAVLSSRADGFGIIIESCDIMEDGEARIKELSNDLVGVLVQYPDTEGGIEDFRALANLIHQHEALLSVATDLLALTILKPPGEFGADIAFGSAQRFGVPLGYGGPHAAFFAVADKYKRKIPGRLIGVSKDRLGNKAMRLSLQTREQHIRREKATSNVCTSQALLANMSAFYAIYHGPKGLRDIAEKVVRVARSFQKLVQDMGYRTAARGRDQDGNTLFDTVIVHIPDGKAQSLIAYAHEKCRTNLRKLDDNRIAVSFDETHHYKGIRHVVMLFYKFAVQDGRITPPPKPTPLAILMFAELSQHSMIQKPMIPSGFQRSSSYLQHPVFNNYHSETEMLRYIHHLQSKDLSLVHSMIPLGSCTMKLNATVEMATMSLAGFSSLHPFVPLGQANGYRKLITTLEQNLAAITGLDAVSLQPNSGAQGEFAGLRLIRKYLENQPGPKRDICLIPVSAHGTNPASAVMAGMRVVTVKCNTTTGNLDMEDLKAKCEQYKETLGAIMITYPSTFGVFEPEIRAVCNMVHEYGGQVYMDGANMNAQIGLCSPGEIGADLCHLNLHKTFCIPHGGGGPGVGPICVKEHLRPYLPGHPLVPTGGEKGLAPVSAAPWGSASILPISWAYIHLMRGNGLKEATEHGLLNANYIMSRLRPHYPILYTNSSQRCAHEFILDTRKFKETAGIEAIDIAKRLQDYGFHAPTMSWPVANTLMIEPTESENKAELDRFADALISIREEIKDVEEGKAPRDGNLLKMAPHNMKDLIREDWERPYTREQAAYPLPYLKERKFWPTVTRLDDAYGDINLFCTCEPIDSADEGTNSDGITGAAAPFPT